MTTSEDDDEIITEDIEDTISFTKEEIAALLQECKYSYISYFNPIAKDVVRRMMRFADEEF